jgi:hypothetical protein
MSKSFKFLSGLCCFLVFLAIQFQITEAADPIVYYSGVFTGVHNVMRQTVPESIKSYPIRVFYEASATDNNNYWYYEDAYFRVNINSQTKILRYLNSKITGFFDIPSGQSAEVIMDTGKRWTFEFIKWGMKCYFRLTYHYDTDPPQTPDRPFVKDAYDGGVYSPSQSTTYTRYNPVPLTWTTPSDNATVYNNYTYGPSGVKDYLVYNGSNAMTGWITGNQANLDLNDGSAYYVGLCARDNDGNISGTSLTRTIIVDRTPPSGSFLIKGTDPNNIYTNKPNVTLQLTGINDGGSGVSEVRFSNNDQAHYSAWEPCNSGTFPKNNWLLTGNDGPKTVYAQLKDKVGNITTLSDTITLDTTPPQNGQILINNGDDFTHSQYVTLSLSAIDSNGVSFMRFSNISNNDNDFLAWEPYSTSREGWPLSSGDGNKTVYVQFQDGAGNRTTQIIRDSIYYDNTPPAGSISINGGANYTKNTAVTLNLTVNDSGGVKVSRMRFSNNGSDYSSWEPFAVIKSNWTLTNGPGLKTVFVQCQDEYQQTSTFSDTITLDTLPPRGAFCISDPNGKILDNNLNPANTATIRITNITANDDSGALGSNSGVRGVYFWNGSGATRPAGAIYYKLSDLPAAGFDFDLAGGADGPRTVTMQVEDVAGNVFSTQYTVALDTTPPGAPGNFKHSYANNQLEFTWQADDPKDDLDHFTGRYTLPGGTPIPFEVAASDTGEGGYCIQTQGLDPNQQVLIEVSSVDHAGNKCDSRTSAGYTPARLGNLQFKGVSYDVGTGRHQLQWQLDATAGSAKSYRLEYGNLSPAGFSTIGAITSGPTGLFIHDSINGANLEPHGTYQYRLVAYNNSDDPTYGEVFDQQVPNLAPAKPLLISPLGFARGAVEFTYQPAMDDDGDVLTYQIYLSTSPEPDSFSELPDHTATGLIPGQTYYWYVQARDTYGGVTDSNTGEFTVDTTAPVLSAVEPARPYTNQAALTLTAGDDRSGVDRMTYQKIAASTNEILEEGTVTTITGPAGTVTGTITLTEGSYHLHITAWDQAGNTQELQINNLWVDHTAPELNNVLLGWIHSQNRYFLGQLMVPAIFSANDGFSGTAVLRYWLLKDQNEPLNSGQTIYLSPGLTNYAYTLELPGVSGWEYYLALAVEDRAGNRSAVTYLGPFLIDLTPPQVNLTLGGLRQASSGLYTSGLSEITVSPVATDPETGIGGVKLNLFDVGAGTLVAPWSDWPALQTAGLIPGRAYRIVAKAANHAGLTTQSQSEAFTVDNTPPQVSVTGPTGRLASGETICFDLAATDPETPVTGYRLAIADYNNPEQTLPVTGGDSAGWLAIPGGGSSTQVRLELPPGADGVYYPAVVAYNAAGLVGTRNGAAFILDNAQEKMLVSDQGPYTMFAGRLSGWWQSTQTKPINHYRYRIVTFANQIVQDWQTTTGTSVAITGLSLTHGAGYRFEVQAYYSDGTYSEPGFSPGVTVDLTAPELTGFVTPEYCSSANLKVQWAGQDPESGIQTVQAALGSGFQQTDVSGGWVTLNGTTAILSRDAAGQPLQLITGKRYYVTLRLTNNAGLITEGTGAAITIDDTPPPAPVVLDQGAYLNTRQPLEANWIWSRADPESGPDTYQWALLQYGQDLENAVWQDGDSSKQLTLTDFQQQHGYTYYFAVRAVNRAGLSSIGVSNGIMIDATAPYLPKVRLQNAVNLGDPAAAEVNYITNNQNLGLWIEYQDPESPVDKYLYTWGQPGAINENTRLESADPGIPLNNPEITEGTLTIFAGECANQAQLVSGTGYSSGVMLDTGAPKIVDVHAGVSGDRFYFDWNVVTSVSPVAKYEVALVKVEDTIPPVWIDNGLERSYTYDGRNLADGKYYLFIRATNEAGTTSRRQGDLDEWGASPVVALDRAAPVISDFTCDRYASNQLKMQLTAADNLSGIGGYQYALGSKTNPLQYSGGWVDIDSQAEKLSYQIPVTGIPQLREVYLMVRAKDRAGLWSATQISPPINIDHSPPLKPAVTCGRYTTSKQEIRGVQYTSGDPESGVTHYRLEVVTQPGGEPLAVQLRPAGDFDGRMAGLELSEAGVYYLAMQTQNGAGDWSETGYSEPVMVDTIAPQLVFSQGGSTIVINQPPVAIEYTLSEAAQVKFTQTGADGVAKEFTVSAQAGLNQFIFTESQPQVYQIAAQAVDAAGNSGQIKVQTIRVNAPPRITLAPEFDSTPGARVQFQASVVDPDGTGAGMSYLWEPGDGSGSITGEAPEHQYLGGPHDYQVTLTVTDADGGVATATTVVKVRNTSRGTLYMDETWRGVHRISGQVIVPAGVTLTIEPGAEVIIDGIPGETSNHHSLIIKGALKVGSGTHFHSVNGSPTYGWKGISIEGKAFFEGMTIEDAQRGLIITGMADVTVINCVFEDNYIGIHVCGGIITIQNSTFIQNLWYGIKEDLGGAPVVIDCRFEGNEMDYYDENLTEISIEQLNGMPGNRGNR